MPTCTSSRHAGTKARDIAVGASTDRQAQLWPPTTATARLGTPPRRRATSRLHHIQRRQCMRNGYKHAGGTGLTARHWRGCAHAPKHRHPVRRGAVELSELDAVFLASTVGHTSSKGSRSKQDDDYSLREKAARRGLAPVRAEPVAGKRGHGDGGESTIALWDLTSEQSSSKVSWLSRLTTTSVCPVLWRVMESADGEYVEDARIGSTDRE